MEEITPKDIRLAAMNLLARREHLRAELQAKLLKRFGLEIDAGPVLVQLMEDGLLSDERFVESYIRHRSSNGYGPDRIEQELRQKGAAGELVCVALKDCELDWLHLARGVRLKKFGAEEPIDFTEKSRQLRFLQYRGFGGQYTSRLYSED
jgi:regulatory protein